MNLSQFITVATTESLDNAKLYAAMHGVSVVNINEWTRRLSLTVVGA